METYKLGLINNENLKKKLITLTSNKKNLNLYEQNLASSINLEIEID